MIVWLIFAVVFIVLAFLLLRAEHLGRKVKVIVFLLIAILLFLSINALFSSNVDLSSPGGVVKSIYAYFGWMGRTMGNLFGVGKETVVAVGHAINLNMSSG